MLLATFDNRIEYKSVWRTVCFVSVAAVRRYYEGTLKSHVGIQPLTQLLAMLEYHQSTDPHDRVYAVHGLLGNQSLYPSPDFSMPAGVVHWNAQAAVIKHETASIWQIFDHFQALPSRSLYPSWVPDLNNSRISRFNQRKSLIWEAPSGECSRNL